MHYNRTVNRSFAILPPLHADFFCARVLSGRAQATKQREVKFFAS
jgi:hypothetical protein